MGGGGGGLRRKEKKWHENWKFVLKWIPYAWANHQLWNPVSQKLNGPDPGVFVVAEFNFDYNLSVESKLGFWKGMFKIQNLGIWYQCTKFQSWNSALERENLYTQFDTHLCAFYKILKFKLPFCGLIWKI